jgi:hypothetical protein
METYYYRGYRIDLHPAAGGFRAFIFRPGEGNGLKGAPSLAGPDGHELVHREMILRESIFFIDRQIAAAFAAAGPLRVVDGGNDEDTPAAAKKPRRRSKRSESSQPPVRVPEG